MKEFTTLENLIKSSEYIFLAGHKNCADSISSLTSFSFYLESLEKRYYLWIPSEVPENLKFLSNVWKIKFNKIPILENFDLFIFFDSGDLRQLGLESEMASYLNNNEENFERVVNIDHHITNEYYGHLNIVDKNASSTTEIIYKFFKLINFKINSQIATLLLAGIISDTGGFTNKLTSITTFKIVSDLISYGVNTKKIIENILGFKKSLNVLQLWGDILSKIKYNKYYKSAIVMITQEELKKYNVTESAIEGLANFLNNLSGVKLSIVIREVSDNKVKVSLRTTEENIDVSKFAKCFGGGGHKRASGFTIYGRIKDGKLLFGT